MLLNAFRRLFSNSPNRKARRACPPQLLQLEGRIVPATITVTTTSDAVGHSGISLRDAITTANGTSANDNIDFSVTGTITLDSVLQSLPTIASATSAGTLTITGPGASSLTISGLDNSSGTINANRDFRIFNITIGGDLSLSGVTVSGAYSNSNGGGILNYGGTLAITNSTLSDNTSRVWGGGIDNSGILTVTNSTISDNFASYFGGGINTYNGIVTVTNSTLSGNTAKGGGGILNGGTGTLNVINSTISGNTATSGNGGGPYGGGGINNYGATLNIANTIIA